MATLYKLADEYTDLLARLEAAEDEAETEAVWQEMDALEDDWTYVNTLDKKS